MFEYIDSSTKIVKDSSEICVFTNSDIEIDSGEIKTIGLGIKINKDKIGNLLNNHFLYINIHYDLIQEGLISSAQNISLDYNEELTITVYNPVDDVLPKLIKGSPIAQILLLEHKTYML